MNRSDWQTRLASLQRQRKKAWREVNRLDTDIAECFVNIEGKRRREIISQRKLPRRERKAIDGRI